MTPKDFGYVQHGNICLFVKGPLSQWYGSFQDQAGGFKFLGHTFNCCEQFMMASKASIMRDAEAFDKIIYEECPRKQKELGRKIRNFDQKLWDIHKECVVFNGNMLKFSQNLNMRDFLLSFSRHTIFAEAAPWDRVWGIGLAIDDPRALQVAHWKGQNLLGRIISKVRQEIS